MLSPFTGWSHDRIHLRGFGARLRLFASGLPGRFPSGAGAVAARRRRAVHTCAARVRVTCRPADRGRATATPRPRARDARRPTAPRRESRDTMRPAPATLRIDLVAWSRAVAHAVFVCVGGNRQPPRARCSCVLSFWGARGLAGGAAVGAASHTCRSTRSHTVTRRRYLF